MNVTHSCGLNSKVDKHFVTTNVGQAQIKTFEMVSGKTFIFPLYFTGINGNSYDLFNIKGNEVVKKHNRLHLGGTWQAFKYNC